MYYVYILASRKGGSLYIGVTNNLLKRMQEHRDESTDSFTKKYHIKMLVYYEETTDVNSAIQREKQLKKWNREWKERLIQEQNPDWEDLSNKL